MNPDQGQTAQGTTDGHTHRESNLVDRMIKYVTGQLDLKLLQARYIVSNVAATVLTLLLMSLPVTMFVYCLTVAGAHYVGLQLGAVWEGFMVMALFYFALFFALFLARHQVQNAFDKVIEKSIDGLIVTNQLKEEAKKLEKEEVKSEKAAGIVGPASLREAAASAQPQLVDPHTSYATETAPLHAALGGQPTQSVRR